MGEISVAIADDNERILDLLGEMVSSDKELHLVGKANNGEDAYSMIKEKQPDVVFCIFLVMVQEKTILQI